MTFRDFLRQPSTVGGLAALCGTLEAAITGQMSWAHALPFIVGAVVSILLPDNSAARADAEALIRAAETFAGQIGSQNTKPPSQEKP